MITVRVALVGDYNPEVKAHRAIPLAVARAAEAMGMAVEPAWIATPLLEARVAEQLAGFDGVWVVPASPYASMEGALVAIRHAREGGVPFLGTCGGFQHTLIEYARNVLGLAAADHAESNPAAALPLIGPLACALVDTRATIHLAPGTRSHAIYGTAEVEEEYNCRFGLSSAYGDLLAGTDLHITGRDATGEVRVIELITHPFFIATLFQPERSALAGRGHPLITAYVAAMAGARLAIPAAPPA